MSGALEIIEALQVRERVATPAVVPSALHDAAAIIARVRTGGEPELRAIGEELGDLEPNGPLLLEHAALERALADLECADREALERTASRIEAFARAQRAAIGELDIDVPGGRAGHRLVPVASAGCYGPGGRYPLPSSVLMTAIPARVAGVERVIVASPRPAPITLAAAAVAVADAVLAIGGAQAVAALAIGFAGFEAVDFVCGPGNAWVTAAKKLLVGEVGIDMLAGPSELLVIADGSADPALIAADLLAQAEHDTAARPLLVSTSRELIDGVNAALEEQLATLPTRDTASRACANGFAVHASSIDDCVALSDLIGPEHLEIMCADGDAVAARIRHAGAIFIGVGSAEVLGDYGIGPNHTLPTGRSSRFSAGLSVLDFLRVRTEMRVDLNSATHAALDAIRLARLEGLEGHARALERRMATAPGPDR